VRYHTQERLQRPYSLCCHADCTGYDNILVFDFGNGTSLCEGLGQDGVLISDSNCVSSFFNKTCSVYNGSITIVMRNEQGLSGEAYVAPNIATWLNNIGLGSLTILLGDLIVYADHTPYPLPTPIAPVFLTDMQQALDIFVRECEDCLSDPVTPPVNPSRLIALPGLQQVIQLNGDGGATVLLVAGTGFQDLASFSGLACVQKPAYLFFININALQSFNGLEAVQPLSNGDSFYAIGSGPFSTAASVVALTSLAGCDSGPTSNVTVIIPIGCGQEINSLAEICNYQGVICR
jgi:hypothetical protein